MDRIYWFLEIVIENNEKYKSFIKEFKNNELISTWNIQMSPIRGICDLKDLICFVETETNTHFFLANIPNGASNKKKNYRLYVYGFSDSSNISNYFNIDKRKLEDHKVKFKKLLKFRIYCNNENIKYFDMTVNNIFNSVNKEFIVTFSVFLFASILVFAVCTASNKKFESKPPK